MHKLKLYAFIESAEDSQILAKIIKTDFIPHKDITFRFGEHNLEIEEIHYRPNEEQKWYIYFKTLKVSNPEFKWVVNDLKEEGFYDPAEGEPEPKSNFLIID